MTSSQALKSTALFLLLALTVGGCATSTPYAPTEDRFGYSEQRIEADRYRVVFNGNSSTTRETVESYLLFRAAELTLEQGYDYFIVTEQDTETETTFRTRPIIYGHYGHYGHGYHHFPYFAYGFSWADDQTTSEIRRYEAVAYIVMRGGDKPEDDPTAYDAREVMNNLGPVIVRPSQDG